MNSIIRKVFLPRFYQRTTFISLDHVSLRSQLCLWLRTIGASNRWYMDKLYVRASETDRRILLGMIRAEIAQDPEDRMMVHIRRHTNVEDSLVDFRRVEFSWRMRSDAEEGLPELRREVKAHPQRGLIQLPRSGRVVSPRTPNHWPSSREIQERARAPRSMLDRVAASRSILDRATASRSTSNRSSSVGTSRSTLDSAEASPLTEDVATTLRLLGHLRLLRPLYHRGDAESS